MHSELGVLEAWMQAHNCSHDVWLLPWLQLLFFGCLVVQSPSPGIAFGTAKPQVPQPQHNMAQRYT